MVMIVYKIPFSLNNAIVIIEVYNILMYYILILKLTRISGRELRITTKDNSISRHKYDCSKNK